MNSMTLSRAGCYPLLKEGVAKLMSFIGDRAAREKSKRIIFYFSAARPIKTRSSGVLLHRVTDNNTIGNLVVAYGLSQFVLSF